MSDTLAHPTATTTVAAVAAMASPTMEPKRSTAGPVMVALHADRSQQSLAESSLGEGREEDPRYKAYHARLTAFFWAHDPRRVDKVAEILARQQGREEEYIQRVHMEYGERDFSGETAVDDLYEHERYSYLSFSWGSSFPGHLLPTDRRRWSGLHGSPSSQKRTKVEPQLPVNWRWVGDWEVDVGSSNCDKDGWIYAFDFTMLNFMVKRDGGRKEPKATDYVRRRRWIRRRERVPVELAEAPESEHEEKEQASQDPDSNNGDSNGDGDRQPHDQCELGPEDLDIPDSLDVDDEDGEDPGDDEEDDNDGGIGVPFTWPPSASAFTDRPNPPASTPPCTPKDPPTLQYFSMDMEKGAIEAAWKMAVKNLEAIYTEAKSHQTLQKKRWAVKKEKIRQQINLLEKSISSMQSFVHDEQLQRRHSSSVLVRGGIRDSASTSKSPARMMMSPQGGKPSGVTTASHVGPNDTNGINLATKLQCAQSKLDALKRMYFHPREKQYTLRFSIDGIFYGLRDFIVESFTSTFSVHMNHQSNGAQGITPSCKITLKGHTVCCGKHVKVIGDKGTIVPKSLWDMMYLDSDFEATIYLVYVDNVEDEQNPWLSDKATGKWEFLFTPESTRVDLINFSRRTKGGIDLPEPMVRKLMSDVLSSLVRDLALSYFPQELAMAFSCPPSKMDMEGQIEITGPSIDHVMEREIELSTAQVHHHRETGSSVSSQTETILSSPSPQAISPSPSLDSPKRLSTPKSPVAAPFVAVAAVATATVNLLVGSDTDECMKTIAEVLELTRPQLNLLVALRQCGLYPAPYSFRSIASICDYYRVFFKEERDNGNGHVEQLRKTWRQLLELLYIKKNHSKTSNDKGVSARQHKFELFDMDKFFDRIDQLTRKPADVKVHVSRFHCTVDAMSVVEAMAQMFERLVLGIDYSKPRTNNDRLIYGFRFGRKPKVATAAALATHTQSTQLLDPTIHLQMDEGFRNRLKAFSKFCRSLKGVIELVKKNLDNVSVEVAGHAQGTGRDCAISGSFRDLDYTGPVNLSLHVPALFLGTYRAETVPLGGDRIGLQLEVMMPQKLTRKRARRDPVLIRAILTDFAMDVLLDIDALIDKHHKRSISNATEVTAPWSPSASFAHQVETAKTNEKHPALSIAVHSTTGTTDIDADEQVIRIPSPTSKPGQPYGKIRMTSSEFTKLHVRAKSGSFATRLLPLIRWVFTFVRPFFLASFPEHPVLFDRIYDYLLQFLSSAAMRADFELLVKGFIHSDDKLFFTICGAPGHPCPVTFHDQIYLLDTILQGDDLINLWIDDRYPPYASPLYF